jgi:hypothetical protein
MALFFDHGWYDARLAERGLGRAVLAAVAGMSPADLDLAFKDQRELSKLEVSAFAELLGISFAEAALRAGVGGHALSPVGLDQKVAALEARVAALEAQLARLRP